MFGLCMSTVHLFIWTTQYTTECKITIIVSKPIHTSIRIVGDIIVISSEAATNMLVFFLDKHMLITRETNYEKLSVLINFEDLRQRHSPNMYQPHTSILQKHI
jgi:hypothetical protein